MGSLLRRERSMYGLVLVLGIAALIFAGCSGGNGPTFPSPDGPGDGNGGDQPDDGEMTNAETVAAVENYGDRYVEMLNDGMTIPEAMAQLATEMEQSGDFSAVEVDGTGQIVWAEFTNGWPYAVVGNRPPISDDVADQRAEEQLASAGSADTAAAVELPDSRSAVLLNGFGKWRPGAAAAIDAVDGMLSQRGYQTSQQAVTVANLQSLGNPGVVFINSHGAAPHETSLGRPALWLDEPITQARADQYKALGWNENDYMTMLSTSEDDPDSGASTKVQHFAVTDKFIANEVSLGTNSVVFAQSCSSGVEAMRNAYLAAGAGVYAGWSDWCAGSAAPKYFFDRMVAADAYQPENPPQRPFDWQFVFTDIQDRGLDEIVVDYGFFGGLAGDIDVRTAYLHFYSNDDTGILAPTIRYMDMNEQNSQLVIHGVFGTEQGEVTVGGQQVVVQSWGAERITCELPTDGPGSAGPVVVKVDEHESNKANLTEWRGDFSFTWTVGQGSLAVDMDLDLHWRGDMRKFRQEPGAQPIQRDPRFFEFASDSTGTWNAHGEHKVQHEDGSTTTTVFTGSGPLNWYHSQYADLVTQANLAAMSPRDVDPTQDYPFGTFSEQEGVAGFGLIRPEQRDIQMTLLARADITVEAYSNGALEESFIMPVEIPIVVPDLQDGRFPSQLPYIQLTLDDSFHASPGSKRMTANEATWELTWGSILAEYGPDSSHER